MSISLRDLANQITAQRTGGSMVVPPTPSLLTAVEASRTKRVFNDDIFKQFASQHRQHQVQALESTVGKDIGQIIIPTGTGKTRVQVHLHVQSMIDKLKNDQTGVYVIGAHRLLLCKQLMVELQDMCLVCGIPINTLYIGSARQNDKADYDKYFHKGIDSSNFESTYTTAGDDVVSFYERTKAQNRNLIIVSTYHSFDRMKKLEEIDLCTYDEAHTTIAEDFTENIKEVMPKIKQNFFFTATRKVCGDNRGMNDQSFYGEIITEVSPRSMIEAGEIVMPRIHAIMLSNDRMGEVSNHNELMLVYTIIEAFKEHKKKIKADSCCPDELGAKMLVSVQGSNELEMIQNNDLFKTWCTDNNIRVFSYSSRFGNYENFEENPNRNKIYESMRSLKDNEDCILLHIDILTEGIDLPSITGVLLLRHLNEVKLFQALGRALRLLKTDRENLYNGLITPKDTDKFVKPFAYLILPTHFEKMDESSGQMMETLQRVISTYGIPTEDFFPPEVYDGVTPCYLDPVTEKDAKDKNDKLYPLFHTIYELDLTVYRKSLPSDPALAVIQMMEDLDKL